MKKTISCKVNGENRIFEITPNESLLDLLRRSNLIGAKRGCDDGACGSCSVIMEGKSINACITFAFQLQGRSLETIEGIGDFDNPHPLQSALVEAGGCQCGFCIPGFVMSVKALLDEIPNPDRDQLEENLDGNFCRCTGYEKIEDAIHMTIHRAIGGEPKWKR